MRGEREEADDGEGEQDERWWWWWWSVWYAVGAQSGELEIGYGEKAPRWSGTEHESKMMRAIGCLFWQEVPTFRVLLQVEAGAI